MRLIDADKLKKHYAWWGGEEKEIFDTIVDMQPTIEAEPIRHGRWIDNGANYKCSNCGNTESYYTDCYCRVCGAKMDGKENEK